MNNDRDLSDASVLDEWRQSTYVIANERALFVLFKKDMINFHEVQNFEIERYLWVKNDSLKKCMHLCVVMFFWCNSFVSWKHMRWDPVKSLKV